MQRRLETLSSGTLPRVGRRAAAALTLALLLAAASAPARADLVFADFSQTSDRPFTFTNTGSGSTFTASTTVNFEFTNVPGAPAGFQTANLSLTASAVTPASVLLGTVLQPIDGATNTLAITANGQNLLTAVFNGVLVGGEGGQNLSISPQDPANTVIFTSDFLNFSGSGPRSFNLSLPTVDPPVAQDANGFLASFFSDALGTFSTQNAPVVVPEPASFHLAACGLALVALAARTRSRRRVTN